MLPYYVEDSYTSVVYEILSYDKVFFDGLSVFYGKADARNCVEKVNRQKIVISIFAEGGLYQLTCPSRGIDVITDNPFQVIENIIFETRRIMPGVFAVHAGAVGYGGRAYIFTAPTGGGKTTLSAYLSLCDDFSYITDDCAYVDMQSFEVCPCPRPIHLREDSLDVLRRSGGDMPETEYIETPTIKRYVFTPKSLSKDRLNLDTVFFIERTENENGVLPMKASESMRLLMQSTITEYKIDRDYLRFIADLSKRCMKLRYSEMSYVRDYIKRSGKN